MKQLDSPRLLMMLLLACLVSVPTTFARAQDANDENQSVWLSGAQKSKANEVILREFSPKLSRLQDVIQAHEKEAKNRLLSPADTQKSTEALEKTRPELRALVDTLTPNLKEAEARLAKLGPAPKDDKKEADAIAAQRKAIADEVAAYDGLIKRAEVLFIQAGQAIATFNSLRRKRFLSGLLRRSDNLDSVTFWQEGARSAVALLFDTSDRIGRLLVSLYAAWPRTLFGLLIVLGLTLLSASLSARLLRGSIVHDLSDGEVLSRPRRGGIVLRRAVSVAIPVALGSLVLYLVCLTLSGMDAESVARLAHSSIYIVVSAFLVSAVHFALLPADRRERLILIDDRSAKAICVISKLYICVWMFDQLLELWDQALGSSIAFVIVRTCVVGIVYGLLIAAFIAIRIRRPNAHPATRRTNGWPQWLFGILALSALAIIFSAAIGYVSLARFAGAQFVATGGLIYFVTLVHLTAEYVSSPAPAPIDESKDTRPQTMFGATIGVVAGITLDILVLLLGVPLLLLQWGYDWVEVRGWVSSAFFGFQVGALRISLLQILIAIGILILGLAITRLVRNMFMRRSVYMFSDASGARQSLAAMLGYIGSILSLVAALGYLGMELSNLALIAGALSVGIGFGLQSIANNFVSGLILLAERPIKVGDWIVVGTQQGIVQKISVRSTQIRTLDRSTLIVPNADLITNSVTNWDHGDSIGRIQVTVGVAYDSDAKAVLELLRKIGRAHPSVIHEKRSPLVTLEAFGDSSLDFSLRVIVRNIRDLPIVQTDLRIAIHEAFRENGIEIPFPQRDVHIRQEDALSAKAIAD